MSAADVFQGDRERLRALRLLYGTATLLEVLEADERDVAGELRRDLKFARAADHLEVAAALRAARVIADDAQTREPARGGR